MVHRKLRLPAWADPRLRTGHDRGVVDEEVDGAARSQRALGERPHAVQVSEVELIDLDAIDAGESLLGGGPPPRRDDHPGAGVGERARRLQPEPGVAAGDHGVGAGQVDAVQDVTCGASGAELRSDRVLRSRRHALHATHWRAL
ncbi:hypothetical protein FHS42_004804 [Streptomyces zagrosensis]|uniref:Uncharacterized protein n=1 Tax=Streptomyces zagrosensis TaxID=1042984 RepID=A0A7W9QCG6_9ACTN|nr:hypothetical protein [Streptomyces zagrosensis]